MVFCDRRWPVRFIFDFDLVCMMYVRGGWVTYTLEVVRLIPSLLSCQQGQGQVREGTTTSPLDCCRSAPSRAPSRFPSNLDGILLD